MFDQVLGGSERAEVLIALSNFITLATSVFPVSHQDRYLGAQLRQLERAFTCVSALPLC
jgi:hypothetical protein